MSIAVIILAFGLPHCHTMFVILLDFLLLSAEIIQRCDELPFLYLKSWPAGLLILCAFYTLKIFFIFTTRSA